MVVIPGKSEGVTNNWGGGLGKTIGAGRQGKRGTTGSGGLLGSGF